MGKVEAWVGLSDADAALLDFPETRRQDQRTVPEDTIRKTLTLISEKGRLECLLKVADSEPPRIRALLGALAEESAKTPRRARAYALP